MRTTLLARYLLHYILRSFLLTAYVSWQHNWIMDATRASDGRLLTLKVISKSRHPYEVTISKFLSSPPLDSHPKNHCVPIFDVLQSLLDNDIEIIVMPRLRSFDSPAFDTVGNFLECFRQIFEVRAFMFMCISCNQCLQGIEFMHTHMVAHWYEAPCIQYCDDTHV